MQMRPKRIFAMFRTLMTNRLFTNAWPRRSRFWECQLAQSITRLQRLRHLMTLQLTNHGLGNCWTGLRIIWSG